MNEKEKEYAIEICEIMSKLPEIDQQHLLWIGQGILFASNAKNGK